MNLWLVWFLTETHSIANISFICEYFEWMKIMFFHFHSVDSYVFSCYWINILIRHSFSSKRLANEECETRIKYIQTIQPINFINGQFCAWLRKKEWILFLCDACVCVHITPVGGTHWEGLRWKWLWRKHVLIVVLQFGACFVRFYWKGTDGVQKTFSKHQNACKLRCKRHANWKPLVMTTMMFEYRR